MPSNLTRSLFGLLLSLALTGVAWAMEPILEVRTSYGAVYHQVRILSISGDDVAISHSGGMTNIPAASFDLETLSRARTELDAKAAQKKKAEPKPAVSPGKIVQATEEPPTQLSPPAESPSNDQPAPVKVMVPTLMRAPPRVAAAVSRDQQILKLKAAFPLKTVFGAQVTIVDKATKDQGVVRAHVDVINVDIPSIDVWNWYHGMFQTTTSAALPRTLELVDQKFREDMAAFPGMGGGTSARAQADQSAQWFNHVLRPYIEQWRALTR